MGWGDEGKGKLVDYLCRSEGCSLVVKSNGGSQCGHNVVNDGKHHMFSQIGSGMFNTGVRTLISRFFLLNPIALCDEASVLSITLNAYVMDRIFVDERSVITTPYHVLSNRRSEAGENRHGSVGCGIGETTGDSIKYPEDTLYAWELHDPNLTLPKLRRVHKRKGLGDDPEELAVGLSEISKYLNLVSPDEASGMIRNNPTVFEAGQGVLLDQDCGFAPHNTWTRTTDENARELMKESGSTDELEIIGAIRVYFTRHGTGPFPTELASMKDFNPLEHNKTHEWQGEFRSGGFDLSLFAYALRNCRIDCLAVNHLDLLGEVPFYRSEDIDNCAFSNMVSMFLDKKHYVKLGTWKKTKDVVRTLEQFHSPVKYLGRGPRDVTVLMRP